MSLTRKYNGKKYTLSRQYETKAQAMKGARLSRKSGRNARVSKLPKVWGVRPSRPWAVFDGGDSKRRKRR